MTFHGCENCNSYVIITKSLYNSHVINFMLLQHVSVTFLICIQRYVNQNTWQLYAIQHILTMIVYTITCFNLCNIYIRNNMLLVGLEHDMHRKYNKNVNSKYVFPRIYHYHVGKKCFEDALGTISTLLPNALYIYIYIYIYIYMTLRL